MNNPPKPTRPLGPWVALAGLLSLAVIIGVAVRPGPGPSRLPGAEPPERQASGEVSPSRGSGEPSALPPAAKSGDASALPVTPSPDPSAGSQTPDLPPDHPPISSAPEGSQITLQWLGHACFYLHSPDGITVVMDPFQGSATGLPDPEIGAHLVTSSCDRPQHRSTGAVRAFEGERLEVVGPGGAKRGDLTIERVEPLSTPVNSVFSFRTGGVRIVHLGRMETAVTAEQARLVGAVDILLVPVGGDGLSQEEAAASCKALRPRVVIPMSYSTPSMSGWASKLGNLEAFVSKTSFAVSPRDADVMLFGAGDLPKSTEVYPLRYGR